MQISACRFLHADFAGQFCMQISACRFFLQSLHEDCAFRFCMQILLADLCIQIMHVDSVCRFIMQISACCQHQDHDLQFPSDEVFNGSSRRFGALGDELDRSMEQNTRGGFCLQSLHVDFECRCVSYWCSNA